LSVLEMRLHGELTSRTEFCVGDNVTLVCSIDNIVTYQWTVPGLLESNSWAAVIGNPASSPNPNGQAFTLEATGPLPNTMSTLRFYVSDLLNGNNITCGRAGVVATDFQVISVLGR